jgi:hypothetical protein
MTSSFQQFKADDESIIVVSGLPRSGTSMMMQMLQAGGLMILTDQKREADISNPKGYYEFESVKKLTEGDFEWLDEARGRVVKIISALLIHLPPTHKYLLIFMRRNIEEILRSQKAMLEKGGMPTGEVSDEKLAKLYEHHLEETFKWLHEQPNIEVIFVNYNWLLKDFSKMLPKVNIFLGGSLDVDKMSEIIDNSLYRQRSQPL